MPILRARVDSGGVDRGGKPRLRNRHPASDSLAVLESPMVVCVYLVHRGLSTERSGTRVGVTRVVG